MSYTNDTRFLQLTDDTLESRTVEKIQEKITDKDGRNRLSRLLHARNDKDTIAAWKLDLNRILLVFNVRSVTYA